MFDLWFRAARTKRIGTRGGGGSCSGGGSSSTSEIRNNMSSHRNLSKELESTMPQLCVLSGRECSKEFAMKKIRDDAFLTAEVIRNMKNCPGINRRGVASLFRRFLLATVEKDNC